VAKLPVEKMRELERRFGEIEARMSAGPSADVYVKLASEYSELQPVVTKSQVKICQATAEGGSVPFVPADAKPRPADTAHEVYLPYGRPYAGSCPPPPPASAPVRRSK